MADSVTILIAIVAAVLLAAVVRFVYGFLRFRDRLRAALETTPDVRVTAYTPTGIAVTLSGYPLRAALLGPYVWRTSISEIGNALRRRVPATDIPPFGLVRDRILPVLKRATTLPPAQGYVLENRIVRVPFDDDIVVAYAIEGQFQITYVTEGMLGRWTLTRDTLHTLALENLRAKTLHVLAEIGGPRGEYAALDGFDAARLLVADLIIPPGVTDPLLAIPHEHALLVHDRADADALRERAAQALLGASLPLTAHLYRWTARGPVRANGAA